MNPKLKQFLIPFALKIIIGLISFYSSDYQYFGSGINPHTGILFISGLLFGSYGALGAGLGTLVFDIWKGYDLTVTISFSIISFGISYLSYKLWYFKFTKNSTITQPRLNNIHNLLKFMAIIIITGAVYAILTKNLLLIEVNQIVYLESYVEERYFLNYVNFSLILGVIGIWIARKMNYINIPEKKEFKYDKAFRILYILFILMTIISIVDDHLIPFYHNTPVEFSLSMIILFICLLKPNTEKINIITKRTTTEKIMDIYMIISVAVLLMFFLNSYHHMISVNNGSEGVYEIWTLLFSADTILLIFFIPALLILSYIERNILNPIESFSHIQNFIKEGEKIESKGLLELYSDYTYKDNEIGILARSYSDLIEYNNHYIENIKDIESEKERIKAELDIARQIQQGTLPTESIENEYFNVFGYSKPAKEVGGDFYDYYELDDDNLAIIIGDASDKGVPAALFTTTTQTLIRQILYHEKDPSKALYILNNQLCRNNPKCMFITLALGIYNKKTKVLTYTNGGHNPPIIKKDNHFELVDVDEGMVLGLMEDCTFEKQEIPIEEGIILYTDGITDADNINEEMYGENRFINILNNNPLDKEIINNILEDINQFSQNKEQFDDMTILILKN